MPPEDAHIEGAPSGPDRPRSRRLVRILLRAYPREFRTLYADEFGESVDGLEGAAAACGQPFARSRLWLSLFADGIATGTRERFRERRRRRLRARYGSPFDSDYPPSNAPERMDWMNHLRYAFKSLRRSPGYALAFAVTLGLAIGVNSAVFSVVNGVLLEPLPFQDGDRIMYLQQPVTRAGVENNMFSFIEIDDYRAASTTIDEFVEFGDWDFSVVGEGEPHRAVGGLVTSNYFEVLGMSPGTGRMLGPEDDQQGAAAVMVLTHEYWTRAFGEDPSIVGRTVELTGTPTQIVGVLEPGMHYTGSRRPDFYVNYSTNNHYQGAAMRDARDHRMTDVFARLAPGVDPEAASAELESVAASLRAEYPEFYPPDLGYDLTVTPWQEQLTRQARPTFLLLMGTVAAILLLACANVTNLTLTRLIRREDELATRGALGATGADLRMHLTAENVLLATGGAILGLGMAWISRGALVAYASRFTIRAQEVAVDPTVLAVTLGVAVAVAIALAWLPGLPVAPTTRRVASTTIRATHGRWRKRVQRGLVVTQLALSFTLLAGAGLLVRSMLNLYAVDPGFRTEDVLTLQAPPALFANPQEEAQFFRQVVDRVRTFPGVQGVGAATWAPLTGRNPIALEVRIDGLEDTGGRSHLTDFNNVSPEFFEVLDMQLVGGRLLTHMDMIESDSVLVINQSMADAYFPEGGAVGKHMAFSFNGVTWNIQGRVVGVVADAHEYGMDREGIHTVYRPADQVVWGPALITSTQGDPAPLMAHIREVVRSLDPDRPVDQVQMLDELRSEDVAPSRLNATLFGAFAVLALVIAGIGVLGVLAFSVSQRIREFGIRMALGADRALVLRSVLGEGFLLVVLALAIGAGATMLLGRALSGLLFSVEPFDPTSLLLAAVMLGSVAMLAAWAPAMRATSVRPAEALRAE